MTIHPLWLRLTHWLNALAVVIIALPILNRCSICIRLR